MEEDFLPKIEEVRKQLGLKKMIIQDDNDLHYTHNISGEPPPVVVKNKKKIVSIDESDKE